MAKIHRPRHSSLQYWPRKRSERMIPSVNWRAVQTRNPQTKGLLGFIAYKVGMSSAYVKDLTPNSMMKDKKVVIPVTILEVPGMKVLSIRAYNKEGTVETEVMAQHLDKELKRKIRMPKTRIVKIEDMEKEVNNYSRITIVAYSLVGKIGLKKTPDIIEIAIGGSTAAEQFNYAKTIFDKEIKASEQFPHKLVDFRGVTTGKGLTGPIKRYGLELKQHKSEKGRRRPGSLAPWHPARTTYMSPNAGQMGLFSRVHYNNQVIMNSDNTKTTMINHKGGWKSYGEVTGEFLIVKGSVQGPVKRGMLLTLALRKTKKQDKKKFEFIDLR